MLLAVTLWGAQVKPGAPTPAPADIKPAEYVGSETCQMCHEDIFNAFQKNPHHEVEINKKYKFDTKACEACHGPGSKHAESTSAADIRNPARLKPADADLPCVNCHLIQRSQSTGVKHVDDSYARNGVACASCHAIHKNGPNGLVADTAADVNKQCAVCHTDVWASFRQPFRHRLPEGAMSCLDCHPDKRPSATVQDAMRYGSDPTHNPHARFLPKVIQTARSSEPNCFKCHGDKAGPFVFEHAPVRLDGCTACHMPHGSSNPRMLTRSDVRFVCLECHSNLPTPTAAANPALGSVPPAFHDLRAPQFRECTTCHQKVHGSYVDRGFLR